MIAPRDRPLPGAARALMAHVRGALAGRTPLRGCLTHTRTTYARCPDRRLHALAPIRLRHTSRQR